MATHPPWHSRRTITNLIVGVIVIWGPQAVRFQCSHPILSSNERPHAHENRIRTEALYRMFLDQFRKIVHKFSQGIFETGLERMNLAA
ncbi:hypothetical protein B0H11DRAFT_2052834, partial [Mycena galericulata]